MALINSSTVHKKLQDLPAPTWRYVDKLLWSKLVTAVLDEVWEATGTLVGASQSTIGEELWS